MATITLSFLIFLGAVAGLATGVLVAGRRIQGSCGGLATLPGVESDCGGVCRSQGIEQCPRRLKKERGQKYGRVER